MSRRGLAALVALLAVVWVTTGSALAQPEVQLQAAADGSLVVVGNGWRPGQQLVVGLGEDLFPVLADSAGEFEVPTGLTGSVTESLAVHHFETVRARLSDVVGASPDSAATALAQGVLVAGGGVALLLAGLGALAHIRRAR